MCVVSLCEKLSEEINFEEWKKIWWKKKVNLPLNHTVYYLYAWNRRVNNRRIKTNYPDVWDAKYFSNLHNFQFTDTQAQLFFVLSKILIFKEVYKPWFDINFFFSQFVRTKLEKQTCQKKLLEKIAEKSDPEERVRFIFLSWNNYSNNRDLNLKNVSSYSNHYRRISKNIEILKKKNGPWIYPFDYINWWSHFIFHENGSKLRGGGFAYRYTLYRANSAKEIKYKCIDIVCKLLTLRIF